MAEFMNTDEHVRPEELEPERTDYILKDKPDEEEEVINSYDVKLGVEEEEEFKKWLRDELDVIQEERDELGLEDSWEQNEDQYYGILPEKTFPSENCSNQNVPITKEKTDTVVTKINLATTSPEDIWEVLPTKGGKNISEVLKRCEAKQKFLTHEVRNEIKYEEELFPTVFDSVLHGTGILEVPWYQETTRIRDVEKYKGVRKALNEYGEPVIDEFGNEVIIDPGDLDKFLKNYPDVNKKYSGYVRKLKNGKDIEIVVEYDTDRWNNPRPRYVPLKDFIISPSAVEIDKTPLHGKRYQLTGNELKQMEKDGKVENTDELEWKLNKDGTTSEINDFLTREFTCYTLIINHAFDKDELEQRYLIDIVKDDNVGKQVILKIRHYPYWHNKSYFIPFYISKKKSNSFYRDGLAMMLQDVQDEANIIHNITIDAAMWGVIPMFKANANRKNEIGRQMRKGVYPGATYWLQNMDDLDQFDTKVAHLGDLGNLEQLASKYAELISGVGIYMSGRESPTDPNAPAAKTRMLLQQSNVRVGEFIDSIQKSNREVAFQLIELYYQFRPEGKVFRTIGEDGEYAFPEITRESLRERSEYNPVGSIDTISKQAQLTQDLQVIMPLIEKEPLLRSPLNRRFVLMNIFKNLGGVWEKSVDKLVPSEQEIEQQIRKQKLKQRRQETPKRQKAVLNRAKQLAEQGYNKEQIAQQLEQEAPLSQEIPQGGQGGLPQESQGPAQR